MKIMKKYPSLGYVAASCLASAMASSAFAQDSLQDRVRSLEEELQKLNKEIEDSKPAADAKGVTIAPGTNFQYGGFIKVDAMWSDYSDGQRASSSVGDDFLVPSTIPVDGEGGDPVFDMHAKHSRFWLKTTTNTDAGDVIAYLEMDFNSGGTDERLTHQAPNGLRHAFLQWNYAPGASLLAGQTWSTFFNVAALPETLDFVGPTSGTLFIRQTQVRWTLPMGEGGSLSMALENPSTSLYDGGAGFEENDYDNNSIPDIAFRFDNKSGAISYSAAAVLREITYDTGASDSEEFGYGISLSGKYDFSNGDDLKVMFSAGNLGRYIALNAFRDGVIEADGDIDLNDVMGGYVAYRHMWSDKLRSTFSYAMSTADNSDSAVADLTETVSNANVNLIYSPTPKLSFGAEYIFADRETESGASGDLDRLQFTGKWVF